MMNSYKRRLEGRRYRTLSHLTGYVGRTMPENVAVFDRIMDILKEWLTDEHFPDFIIDLDDVEKRLLERKAEANSQ